MVQIKAYILKDPPNEQTSACKSRICGGKLPDPQPENAAPLGHSTPQTTLTAYSQFFADSKRRASKIIADIIEGKTAG